MPRLLIRMKISKNHRKGEETVRAEQSWRKRRVKRSSSEVMRVEGRSVWLGWGGSQRVWFGHVQRRDRGGEGCCDL